VTEETDIHLASLRRELDEIDAQLQDNIRARIDVCARVALVKREHEIPMMQPGRVGVVQERARAFARRHGLSEDFLASVYELLISEACRVEDLIIDAESTSADRGR
jgi:chorismate mutase-like protein